MDKDVSAYYKKLTETHPITVSKNKASALSIHLHVISSLFQLYIVWVLQTRFQGLKYEAHFCDGELESVIAELVKRWRDGVLP